MPERVTTEIVFTPRELLVLRGVADGLTDARIAGQHSLSIPQVVHAVLWMRKRLKARNRAHLVTRAVAEGLLTVERKES